MALQTQNKVASPGSKKTKYPRGESVITTSDKVNGSLFDSARGISFSKVPTLLDISKCKEGSWLDVQLSAGLLVIRG